MTKSKFRTLGLLRLISLVVLTSILLIWTIPKVKFSDPNLVGLYFILFIFFGFVSTIYTLLKDTKKIEIDDSQIRYRNWLTNVTTTYKFDELDGFVTELTNDETIVAIYVVKDERMRGRISYFFYDNLDEILNGLEKAKFLGSFEQRILISMKISLRQKIKL